MKFLKEYEKFQQNKLNENVMKVDDVYKVKFVAEVPQTLINALIRKVKDESEKNAREFWSDIDISEEIIKYLASNFLNIENLPASILIGETSLEAQPVAQAQAQPEVQAQPEAQPEVQAQIEEPKLPEAQA